MKGLTKHILVDYTKGQEALYIDDLRIEGRKVGADIELTNDEYISGVRVTFLAENVRVLRTLDDDLALIKAIADREREEARSWLDRKVLAIEEALDLHVIEKWCNQ